MIEPNSRFASLYPVWAGQVIRRISHEVVQIALIWYLTVQTESLTVLSFALIVAVLPHILFPPFFEYTLQKINQRRCILITYGAICLTSILMMSAFWLGKEELWMIMLMIFIRSWRTALITPALDDLLLVLAPQYSRQRVFKANLKLRRALGVAAPLLAALIIINFPIYIILGLDIGIIVITLIPLVFTRPSNRGERLHSQSIRLDKILAEISETISYVVHWRGFYILTCGITMLNFLLTPGFSLLPLHVYKYFKHGVIAFCMLESAFSAGVILGEEFLASNGGLNSIIHTILFGILGLSFGVGLMAYAGSDQYFFVLAGILIAGFMNPIANEPVFAIMHAHIYPSIQQRVASLLEGVVSSVMPLSLILVAMTAKWMNVRWWLAIGAIGCMVIAAGGFFIPDLMHIEEERTRSDLCEDKAKQNEQGGK